MYRNIDKQCKPVANCACLLGVIASVIAGITVIILGGSYHYPALQGAGVLYLLFGPFLSWVCVYMAYVFSALLGLSHAK